MTNEDLQRMYEAPAGRNLDGLPLRSMRILCGVIAEEIELQFAKWKCTCPYCCPVTPSEEES